MTSEEKIFLENSISYILVKHYKHISKINVTEQIDFKSYILDKSKQTDQIFPINSVTLVHYWIIIIRNLKLTLHIQEIAAVRGRPAHLDAMPLPGPTSLAE